MNDVHAPEKLRCPSCGGLNPVDAAWCGQCLKRFAAPEPPEPPAPPPAPAPLTGGLDVPTAPKPGVKKGAFRSTDEGILWTCSSCDAENPLEEPACRVCGIAFGEAMKEPVARHVERDPGTVALVSLFFPGAGHAYLGMWPQAIARGVVSVWVGLMTLLFAIGGKGGSATAVAGLFGLVTFALWAVAAHDAFREASDEPSRVLLHGRRFTFLVLGLLTMLLASMFLTALSNR
ncbi:MAG TPA: hypothetical protein VG318_13000 [Actinomycetota bacterium]|nr:hypothetical protein [Actinomycetota bacterium]